MRICLITPGHLSTNPRLVKEARCLRAAGHGVHIVCGRYSTRAAAADTRLIAEFGNVSLVPFGRVEAPLTTYLRQTSGRHAARALVRMGVAHQTIVEAAHAPIVGDLVRAAKTVPADLYIAHYVAALPAAAEAATSRNAAYAFDAEDFHAGERPDEAIHRLDNAIVRAIERRYLQGAAYVTAASPMIAEAYSSTYGIPKPTVILNVFPKHAGPEQSTQGGSVRPGPSIYWFSQTIGPGRGLELAVKAVSLCKSYPHLYLRGTPAHGFRHKLESLADDVGVSGQLHFLEPVDPDDLERNGASFDLGYSGESGFSQNNRIALGNKLFSYLSSGIPFLASDIPAHRDAAAAFGPAMRLFHADDAPALADAVDELLSDRRKMASSREHAWQLGQGRFSWEAERSKLLDAIGSALGKDAHRCAVA